MRQQLRGFPVNGLNEAGYFQEKRVWSARRDMGYDVPGA